MCLSDLKEDLVGLRLNTLVHFKLIEDDLEMLFDSLGE